MRLASLLVVTAACTNSWGQLSIDPVAGPPLGVGLVQHYDVTQDYCEGGVDGSCDPQDPGSLAVVVRGGSSVAITQAGTAWFELTGLAEGSSDVHLTGSDGWTADQVITAGAVAKTSLYVTNAIDPYGLNPPVESPMRAFMDTEVTIAQASFGPAGEPRAGLAPITLAAGSTQVTFEGPCSCASMGEATGTAVLSTPLAAFEIDVVDDSAMADFTIAGATTATTAVTAYLDLQGNGFYLLALDASGAPIVGYGPDATLHVADPSILTAYDEPDLVAREITLQPLREGTTTVDVTWGGHTKTFTVTVTHFFD